MNKGKRDLYFGLVGSAGLIVLIASNRTLPREQLPIVVIVTLLYAALSQLVVRLPGGMTISAAYPLVATAIVAFGPGQGMLVIAPGLFLRLLVHHDSPLRVYYNIGQISISCMAAGAAFNLAGGHWGQLVLPTGVAQFVVMSLAFDLVNMALVQGRVTLEQGGVWVNRWWNAFAVERGWVMPIYHALGLSTALLYFGFGAWGLITACFPLLGLHAFFSLQAAAVVAREQALTDRLTGLANYRGLSDWLGSRTQPVADRPLRLTMLWYDLDGLKRINDTYGHETGNEMLRATAAVLRASTRKHDLVARYGGDEFVVVLDDISPAEAKVVASRIGAALTGAYVECGGERLALSLSVGSASLPHDAATVEALMVASDKAMYADKQRRAALRAAAAGAQ